MLILTQKCHVNPSDLDQTHMIHSCTHACVENTLLFTSTYKDIQNILVTTHIYIFSEKILTRMLKVLCQNYICSYHNYFTTTNYPHTFEVFYQHTNFVVSFIFIYTYMHIGESISRLAHTCIWKGTFMPSIYTWGAIPHHIFIWEAFSCYLWHGYIFERLLMLLIHKYTYFEMHYLLFIHFARYFYAIYSHTLQHIFMPYIFTHISTHHWKASPTLLRCKVPIMGLHPFLSKNKW